MHHRKRAIHPVLCSPDRRTGSPKPTNGLAFSIVVAEYKGQLGFLALCATEKQRAHSRACALRLVTRRSPPAEQRSTANPLQHLFSLLPLPLRAFREDFLQNARGVLRVSHVEIGFRQIEFRLYLILARLRTRFLAEPF